MHVFLVFFLLKKEKQNKTKISAPHLFLLIHTHTQQRYAHIILSSSYKPLTPLLDLLPSPVGGRSPSLYADTVEEQESDSKRQAGAEE